jgi:hypothetical protein
MGNFRNRIAAKYLPIDMTPAERERLQSLCERIATEQDHEKFVRLVEELNDLLNHKQQRLEPKTKRS